MNNELEYRLKQVEKVCYDYWKHAVDCNTRYFKTTVQAMDYGHRAAVCIEQQFLRIHGQIRCKESVEVPITWWDMFKKQHLHTFVRLGLVRVWNTKTISTFTQQDFLFPHVTDPAAAAKIAQFFDPSSKSDEGEKEAAE